MRKNRKIMSLLLASAMAISVIPNAGAIASETEAEQPIVVEDAPVTETTAHKTENEQMRMQADDM